MTSFETGYARETADRTKVVSFQTTAFPVASGGQIIQPIPELGIPVKAFSFVRFRGVIFIQVTLAAQSITVVVAGPRGVGALSARLTARIWTPGGTIGANSSNFQTPFTTIFSLTAGIGIYVVEVEGIFQNGSNDGVIRLGTNYSNVAHSGNVVLPGGVLAGEVFDANS